jgi:hypothetical protein
MWTSPLHAKLPWPLFEERLLDHETAGFIGASTRDLKGARSGMTKVLRFEVNGAKHRATCTIAYR